MMDMRYVRALLADDHAVVRAGLRKALERISSLDIVGEAGDGTTLRARLHELQPDLLIIDVTMPDFNPITEICEFREQYPDMKILVVSAYDDDVYVQGLIKAGVDGYHLKDQPLSDLRLAVERVLAGDRWISGPLLDKLVAPSPTTSTSVSCLTKRQREVLHLLQDGLDNKSIAQQLGISVKTVERHLTRLYRALDVNSRLEAVSYSLEHPEVFGVPGSAAQNHSSMEAMVGEQANILLVDDNGRYRRQLRRMVGRAYPQAIIHEAEDTATALALARRLSLSLAFVDVVLDDENGIRCTRRLRAEHESLRVVLISAYPDRQFHRLGLDSGAIAFLDKKDIDVAALQHIIEDAVT
jgi:DNA-binding NarL/FixJ family response regulator